MCHGSKISYGLFLIGLKTEEISDQDLAQQDQVPLSVTFFFRGRISLLFYYQIISVTLSFTAEKNKIKSISASIQRKELLTIS